MALVKRSESVQENRRKQLEELRARLVSVRGISSLKDNPEWKELEKIITSFADMEKRKEEMGVVACCGKDSEPWEIVSDIRAARERRASFELIIDLVQKSEEKVEHLTTTIKKIESEFREAQAELA